MCRVSARRLFIKINHKASLWLKRDYPMKLGDPTQNPKKIIGTPKKVCKEPKLRMGAARRNSPRKPQR
jgi:hypothetical protein